MDWLRLTFIVCLVTALIPTSIGQQTGQTLDLGTLSFSTVPIATVGVIHPSKAFYINRLIIFHSLSGLLAPIRRPMATLLLSRRAMARLASQTSSLCPPFRNDMPQYLRVQSQIKWRRSHPSSWMPRVGWRRGAQSFCCPCSFMQQCIPWSPSACYRKL